MHHLIIDTSSIVFGLSNKRNVFESANEQLPNHRIIVSNGIIKELKKIGKGRGKYAKFANVGISLINRYDNIEVSKDSSYADSWITKKATELNCAVCTNDTKLKRSLKAKGITVYSISRSGLLR
jgi:rRNA-processing protein FCF1